MNVRNLVISWHGFIGLFMGLLFLIIGLTGSAIVFHEEIDHTLNSSLWSVIPQTEKVSLDTIASTVKKAYPNLSVQSIRFPEKIEESYLFETQTEKKQRFQVFVNPYTGKLLGARIWEQSLTGFLYSLHYQLLLGKTGEIIVSIVGVMLLVVTITGIILWTGWTKFFNGFKIRFHSPSPIINYDFHKVGGIVSSVFLLTLAFTGLVIVSLHIFPIFEQAADTIPIPRQSPIPLKELITRANKAMPGGQISYVNLSEAQPRKVSIIKRFPEQKTGRFDLSTVELDRYTGEILLANKVLEPISLFKFLMPVAELHFGTFGGIFTRILYVFIGLMPTVLLITGLLLWRRKQGFRAKRNAAIKLE